MLKSLIRLAAWFTAPSDPANVESDPLSHPAIASMNARELADLPLPSAFGKARRSGCCPA